MAYLTEAAVIQRVGGQTSYNELTDSSGTVDPELKKYFLDDVDATLDGYARVGGYTTPLVASDAASVMGFLLDISNFKLRTRGNREASDMDLQLYKDAMVVMGLIAQGKWEFSTPPAALVGEANLDSEAQIFNRSTLSVL